MITGCAGCRCRYMWTQYISSSKRQTQTSSFLLKRKCFLFLECTKVHRLAPCFYISVRMHLTHWMKRRSFYGFYSGKDSARYSYRRAKFVLLAAEFVAATPRFSSSTQCTLNDNTACRKAKTRHPCTSSMYRFNWRWQCLILPPPQIFYQ